jgi:hypothetical protein
MLLITVVQCENDVGPFLTFSADKTKFDHGTYSTLHFSECLACSLLIESKSNTTGAHVFILWLCQAENGQLYIIKRRPHIP